MTGHGSKLSAKKKEAIDALLRMSVEDVAETIGITLQTLLGWQKEKEFSAALRAARRAQNRQCKARMRQGATGAMKSTIQMMYQGKTPATRLKAARAIIRLADEAIEIDDFAAAVQEAEDTIRAAEAGSLPPGKGSKASGKGHGAKLPHVKEAAITALLVKRSIPEAAASVPIGTQTLYTWMQQPAFLARYMAEAGAVFGPAMMMAQQRLSDAVSIIRNFSVDTSIPEQTRHQAALYIIDEMKAHAVEDLGMRLAEMETAPAGRKDLAVTSKTIGTRLHQSLHRIKAHLSQTRERSGIRRMVLVHAVEGRPAGTSVKGQNGRDIWLVPPPGGKQGEAVEAEDGCVEDEAA
jgi:hypothetical protein